MSDPRKDEPTEDELVAFAAALLGGDAGGSLQDRDLLRETVREARALWTELHRVANDGGSPSS